MTATAGRWRPVMLLLAVGWAVVIWLLSTGRVDPKPGPVWMKVLLNGGHAFQFAVLALLAVYGVPRGGVAASVAVACAAYGAVNEWYQLSVPGRVGSVTDWFTDVAGVVFGCFVLAWLRAERAQRPWLGVGVSAAACLLAALVATFF